MPQPTVQARVGNQIYNVTEAQARAFAQAWDSGGIKMLLDSTTIQFATAFANIVLKSCVEDPNVQKHIFQHVLVQLKAAKQVTAPEPAQAPAPAPEKPKSSIILTGGGN